MLNRSRPTQGCRVNNRRRRRRRRRRRWRRRRRKRRRRRRRRRRTRTRSSRRRRSTFSTTINNRGLLTALYNKKWNLFSVDRNWSFINTVDDCPYSITKIGRANSKIICVYFIIKYPQLVFDFALPICTIVCNTAWMARLKVLAQICNVRKMIETQKGRQRVNILDTYCYVLLIKEIYLL